MRIKRSSLELLKKVKRPKERGRAKLTTIEWTTLIFSGLALFLTLLQLIFSFPLLSNYIYGPSIVARQINWDTGPNKPKNGKYLSLFHITNTGNKPAENLVIGFTCFKSDSLRVLAPMDIEIEYRDSNSGLKNLILRKNVLIPDDIVLIEIYSDSTLYSNKIQELSKVFRRVTGEYFFQTPELSEVRHDEGFGEIVRLKMNETVTLFDVTPH
jgi:hypothetical protein